MLIPIKNDFVRNTSTLMSGTVLAQLLLLLSSPILTRLYTPDDFGILASYIAVITFFASIATLRYESAIPIAKSDKNARQLINLCVLISIAITIIITFILLLNQDAIGKLHAGSNIPEYAWLAIPISIFLLGVHQTFYSYSIRQKAFVGITRSRVYQSLAMLVFQLSFFKFGAISLLLGQVIGYIFGTFSLVRLFKKEYFIKSRSKRRILYLAKRYKDFPMYGLWSNIINAISNQLPPILFALYFGAAAAGLYALTQRIMQLPISLFGQAISGVFTSRAVEIKNEGGEIDELVRKVSTTLMYIGIPPTIFVILVAPNLFGIIFGEQWTESGVLARWLAPWWLLVFITSPLTQLLVILELLKHGLIFQVILTSSRMVGLFVGIYFYEFTTTIIIFGVVSAIFWLIYFVWMLSLATKNMKWLFEAIIRTILPSIVISSPVIMFNSSLSDFNTLEYFLLVLASVGLAIPYYWLIYKELPKS